MLPILYWLQPVYMTHRIASLLITSDAFTYKHYYIRSGQNIFSLTYLNNKRA